MQSTTTYTVETVATQTYAMCATGGREQRKRTRLARKCASTWVAKSTEKAATTQRLLTALTLSAQGGIMAENYNFACGNR